MIGAPVIRYENTMNYQLPLFEPEEAPPTVPEAVAELLYDEATEILVAFSGGKDSVAMVLYLLDLGIPKERIILHHHEVDGRGEHLFDWPCTPSYCKAFAAAFELPLVFSWREGGILREMYRTNEGLQDVRYEQQDGSAVVLASRPGSSTRRKFPAVAADLRTRWCSSVAKIDVLSRVIAHSYPEGGQLIICTGERREESLGRAAYKAYEKYRASTKKRTAIQWRPVIDFREKQVWALYEKYNVQPHPCYMLGWPRCSCQTCIFSSPNTWAAIQQMAPWKIDCLEAIENDLGHTLYHGMRIREKARRGRSFIPPGMLQRWKTEAMGEFTSPIFPDRWELPAGAFGAEMAGAV